MTIEEEIENSNSCLNKAQTGEPIFVLLGRDKSAPLAIQAWVHNRVKRGMNKMSDDKIIEALEIAFSMFVYQAELPKTC